MQSLFESPSHVVFRNRDGSLDTVMVGEKVLLNSMVGKLVPRYTIDEQSRKKEAPVKFYKSGQLKSLPLEDATEIDTSIGKINAELLTFYPGGALKRLFPLNGKITGYWTEENEYELAEFIEIPTSVGNLTVKPIYLQFFESGELESIGFWPRERVNIKIAQGEIGIRKGISFYRSGALKGFEPAEEIQLQTGIGAIKVYDPDPNGLFAENNAVRFYENGKIQSVSTASNQVSVKTPEGEEYTFTPDTVVSYCDDSAFFISPMRILFKEDSIGFMNGQAPGMELPLSSRFEVCEFTPQKPIGAIACG